MQTTTLSLKPPDPAFFAGRGDADDPRLGEFVRVARSPQDIDRILADKPSVVILGHVSDEGVRNNRGRAGAAEGPAAIRKALYAFTPGARIRIHEKLVLADLGDAVDHAGLEDAVFRAASAGATVVVLGGGHDTTLPGVRGLARVLAESPAVISVDAHTDVRPTRPGEEDRPNSGTSFRRLIEDGVIEAARLRILGLAEHRVAPAHIDWVRAQGATAVFRSDMRRQDRELPVIIADVMEDPAIAGRALALSVDMDVMPLAGVSAVGGAGVPPLEVARAAWLAGSRPSTAYLDVVECAPSLDSTGRTQVVAAEIVFGFLRGRAASRNYGGNHA